MISIVNKKEPLILFFGDFAVLYLSVWVTLMLRHFDFPAYSEVIAHLQPFSILFVAWIFVIYVAGLYDRMNVDIKRNLPRALFNTQIVNIILAVVFFYFSPSFAIAPKTTLFIYLVVSLGLLMLWRIYIYPRIYSGTKNKAILIARGSEMRELLETINGGNYSYYFSSYVDLDKLDSIDVQRDIVELVYSDDTKTIVVDTEDDAIIPILDHLYNLMFSKVNFVDMHILYEQVFGKIPLSIVKHGWFLKNVNTERHVIYDGIKRTFDIVFALIIGLISLIFYPIVWVLIKLDDGGTIFHTHERIGQDNKKILIYKFRSMANVDGKLEVTKVGKYLRNARIDELPQILNVLKGDLSLIGPRPENSDLAAIYAEQIPYYNVRHLIKPGLSGWAQIYHDAHPHHAVDINETKNKLSYDLFYVKNRSLFLDLEIGLKTLRTIFLRKGR